MNQEEIQKEKKQMTIEQLDCMMAGFEKSAIQRATAGETRKGYDTTGIGYQWCVDRFNEIFLDEWGFSWEILKEREGKYKTGKPFIEITIKMEIWILNKESARVCVGGHISSNYTDALKGAITNGFKKTAAFWGVGAVAFRGELDDDSIIPDKYTNVNLNDYTDDKIKINSCSNLDELKMVFCELWKKYEKDPNGQIVLSAEKDKRKKELLAGKGEELDLY